MTSQLKTAMLLGLLSAIIIILGGLMGGRTGVIFAFGLAVIMNVGSYWYSDKIVLSMYSARELSPEEAPYLHQIVEELAARAGIPKPRVCIVPEEAPNAFATGRNPENAVVAVTDGIMRLLSPQELRGVIAHEIGHIETGSFYNVYSPYDLKEKCERKANRRAVEILMPVDEVRRALRRGIVEPWALAEYLDVTQQFAQMALEIYTDELTRQRRVVGLPPMIRASDLLPRPHKPAVMRDIATLKRFGVLADMKHDLLLNLPDYY